MADPLWENPGIEVSVFGGPLAPLGFALERLVFVVDQAHKWWMLNIYDIGAREPVAFTPSFDPPGVEQGCFLWPV